MNGQEWPSLGATDPIDAWMGGEDEPPRRPRHTPGQAEGEDVESERKRPNDDALYRRRPSQAEGEDEEDEADEVPPLV